MEEKKWDILSQISIVYIRSLLPLHFCVRANVKFFIALCIKDSVLDEAVCRNTYNLLACFSGHEHNQVCHHTSSCKKGVLTNIWQPSWFIISPCPSPPPPVVKGPNKCIK